MARTINTIVIHCSDSTFGCVREIDRWHKERGFNMIGYHYVIGNGMAYNGQAYNPLLDGAIESGRPVSVSGAHARGHNAQSIGICLIGVKNFTKAQFASLKSLVYWLSREYGIIENEVIGHYELDRGKTCPNINLGLLRGYLFTDDKKKEADLLKRLLGE